MEAKSHDTVGVWLLILYGTWLHTWRYNLNNLGRKCRSSFKNLSFENLLEKILNNIIGATFISANHRE